MAEQEECKGCDRPRGAVKDRVLQCGYAKNRSPERCVWLAMQQRAARPDAGAGATLEQQLQALSQELSAARAQTAQIVERLDAESATRIASQAEAAQHKAVADEARARHGFLQSEVERLKELLGRVHQPTPQQVAASPSPPTTARGWAQRVIAWLVASRVKIGSISAALGLVLGAGGVGWWQYSGPPAVPSGNVATNLAPAPPASAQTASASPSTQEEATPQVNALILQPRLALALRQQGLKVTARVEESLNTVSVDVETVDVAQQKKADLIVRSVFAGAGLPDPIIQHAAPHIAVLGSERSPSAPAGVASAAPPHRGASSVRGLDSGANSPLQGTVPPAIQPASLEELCKKKLNLNSWDLSLTLKLTSCMKQECCQANRMQNQECSSFDQQYPLNCRR